MRILIIFTFLSIIINLQAQDTTVFAPISAVWHYNSYTNFHGGGPFYFKFVVEKDTIILGENARLLRYYIFENGIFHSNNNLNKYIITDGAKVYYKVENEFVLLYDFTASVGDTIFSRAEYYPVDMGCYPDFQNGGIEYGYIIDSVSIFNVDGIDLKRQYVHVIDPPGFSTPWFFYNPIIERIGANDYGGFWWGQGGGCILEDNGFLRCYIDNDLTFINTTQFHHDCDYTATNEIEGAADNQLYPNPVSDIVYLKVKIDLINAYNSSGQKIKTFRNQDQIDVSELQPGIYFLQYQSGNTLYIEKFLKL